MTNRHKESDEGIERDCGSPVNMSARELDDWLETEESRSIGHRSRRPIIGIIEAAPASPKTTALNAQSGRHHQAPPCAAPAPRYRAHPLALLAQELGARPAEGLALRRLLIPACKRDRIGRVSDVDHRIVGLLDAIGQVAGKEQQLILGLERIGGHLG